MKDSYASFNRLIMRSIQREIIVSLGFTGMVLLVPLVSMRFSDEVSWSATDFLIGGLLLFGASMVIQWIYKKANSRKHALILTLFFIVLTLLLWAELAVGIFGTPLAGN